jgi:hypothetical protein
MQCLVERLKIVGGHDHRSDAPVAGDLNDLVCGVGLVDQRGKLVFGFGERYRPHTNIIAGNLAC